MAGCDCHLRLDPTAARDAGATASNVVFYNRVKKWHTTTTMSLNVMDIAIKHQYKNDIILWTE